MALSVKSRFAGFLRGLVGRAEKDDVRPIASAPSAPKPVPAPAPAPAAKPAPTRTVVTAASHPASPDEIEVPLAPIVASLPMDIRAKLVANPPTGQTIRLQAEMVIPQLAFGAVKISFGELRHLAPGVFINSGGELDGKQVSLPLQEILSRVNPSQLARRTARKVEVSEEIAGPFSERGRGFTFTTQPLKAPAAPTPLPRPEPEPSLTFTSPIPPRQVTPTPISPMSAPPRSVTPAAPAGNGLPRPMAGSTPPPPQRFTPPSPIGSGNANGHGTTPTPGLRLGSLNGNGHSRPAPTPPAPSAPAPLKMSMSAPESSMVAPAPASAQPVITAMLGDLCEHWPDALKKEIVAANLLHASVPLDGGIIVPGLKRGRILMAWKQLRLLAQPNSAPSPNDNLELELPLKIIAPLFLAAKKAPERAPARASVSAEIPDLFFGFPQPSVPASVTAVSPAPVAPAPAMAPAAKPVEAKPQDTNFYVWGEDGEQPQADEAGLRRGEQPQTDFMNRQAHPKEVVVRAAALPGVAGSVVAMQDGLRVASQVPADLNADTLAAFLPQIFDRLNQSTRELRMGTLNNINFTVGNVPWKIFRVNAVYFAAFGRAGEALPSAQLAQLAGELDRKKQQ